MFNTISRFVHSRTTKFSAYAVRLAEDCRRQGGYSRAANYLTAIHSFTKAVGELPLNKISATVVERYQTWMRTQGICENTASCYNRSLRAIYNKAVVEGLVKETGINIALTSYTMRHSWASLAYKSGVPLPVISQALGHTRPDTTMVYIRSLDNAQMQEGNDKVQRLIGGQN